MLGQLENGISNNGTFLSTSYCRLDIEANFSSTVTTCDSSFNLNELSLEDQKLMEKLKQYMSNDNFDSPYITKKFNILRWAYAYPNNLETAARKYQRHLRIRRILRLDEYEKWTTAFDGVDNFADIYAPITVCGEIGKSNNGIYDNRILLIEKSGRFDLPKIMQTIRTSAFMMNRFRVMERVLGSINVLEETSGILSSAVLIIDLEGLVLHSGLISFISGPYRIMWGTLIEQYPHLISQIFVINTPAFMNLLWNACSSFIPAEYRSKIHLLSGNWHDSFKNFIPIESLPIEYGGCRDVTVVSPNSSCFDITHNHLPLVELDDASMESINISAGSIVIHTFYLKEGEVLEFFMKHDQAFTMNIFFTPSQKTIKSPNEDIENMEEVFAGCERPGGLSQLDFWKWRVPYTGFYHAMFGNEKAWIMPVSMKYQIFQIHSNNGSRIKVNRIQT